MEKQRDCCMDLLIGQSSIQSDYWDKSIPNLSSVT